MNALQVACRLIFQFEGCELSPYEDVVGVWTIGRGMTVMPDGTRVTALTPPITQAQADSMGAWRVNQFLITVEALLTGATNNNQLGAMTSFAYNVGINNLASSTLLRMHNAGNFQMAASQFPRWDMAGGRHKPGLLRRRLAEQQVYLSPVA